MSPRGRSYKRGGAKREELQGGRVKGEELQGGRATRGWSYKRVELQGEEL